MPKTKKLHEVGKLRAVINFLFSKIINFQKQYKDMKTAEILHINRQELKKISNTLRTAKEQGEIKTINEGLVKLYTEQGNSNLKTYDQWQKEGKQVKKNEKALYLWSKETEKTIEENGEVKTFTYFPILPVFSESQVYTISK